MVYLFLCGLCSGRLESAYSSTTKQSQRVNMHHANDAFLNAPKIHLTTCINLS